MISAQGQQQGGLEVEQQMDARLRELSLIGVDTGVSGKNQRSSTSWCWTFSCAAMTEGFGMCIRYGVIWADWEACVDRPPRYVARQSAIMISNEGARWAADYQSNAKEKKKKKRKTRPSRAGSSRCRLSQRRVQRRRCLDAQVACNLAIEQLPCQH